MANEMTDQDKLNNVPRNPNKPPPPKSRNPHPGLQQQSINKAAFLSNKEQVAKIGGHIDQQYIQQPIASTPNSTLNTSRAVEESIQAETGNGDTQSSKIPDSTEANSIGDSTSIANSVANTEQVEDKS